MISVIIPTMWKCEFFPNFLSDLVLSELINEVIIIDNDPQSATELPNNPKITLLNFGRNIFVNPAWNVGVSYSTSPIVCLANDDIIFDLRVFDKIAEQMQCHHGLYGLKVNHQTDGDLRFDPYFADDLFGYGQLMFVWKKNWIDIPPNINVYYGDNFLFDTQISQSRTNYLIKNLLYWTPYAQTTTNFHSFLNRETVEYAKICADMRINRFHP